MGTSHVYPLFTGPKSFQILSLSHSKKNIKMYIIILYNV